MSDPEPPSVEPPPSDEPPPLPMPPLPNYYVIDEQLAAKWFSLPPSALINVVLSRQDVDALVWGILAGFRAQQGTHQTIIDWSNQKIDDANTALYESRRANIEGQNFIRELYARIMQAATAGGA
jgi:hypothetical protein